MKVIPAIDLIGGRCVRLTQGRYEDEESYGDDPSVFAKRWEDAGASYLHMVDLDGARQGAPHEANVEAIRTVIQSVAMPVQVGGGIRTAQSVERLLSIGVQRCILGTSVAMNSSLAQELFQEFGERVVVGIDASNGFVAIKGWKEILDLRAVQFAQEMVQLGAKRIIFTDISRDGMLQGVNFSALTEMLEAVDVPVIASGGVAGVQDIDGLAAMPHQNLEGVIVGKALYAGTLSLEDAIRASGEETTSAR